MAWREIVAGGLAGLFLSQSGYGQTAVRQQSTFDEARSVLQSAVANGTVGSAVGLIARGDQILFLGAFGEIEPGEPMPVNAIARLASIQKPITASAVLILQERGELDLDESVDRWFPDFGGRVLTADGDTVAAVRRPTVFDLLTHQAGLVPEGRELDELWEVATTQEFARRIGQIPLRFQPGSRFEYGCCGSAYEVLAAIVEQVSGRSFKDFLAANVLEPLGMTDTYFFVPESKRHRLAAHYGRDQDGALTVVRRRGQEEPESSFYSGGGGLRSTVPDFDRFLVMLLNGGELDSVRLLSPEAVRMMTTNQVGSSYPAAGYGWGLGVRVQADTAVSSAGPGSFGWNGGTGTQFEVDPESGTIAIVFVPTWPGTPGVSELRTEFISKAIAAAKRRS
jgi:CubicO group peptidase (beta-lactamase class C family)